ncbi:glycosyltransferase family 1 protein [Ruminococcus sp.]|uniref:glycosyltransferase family 4 protein n=1 Tax=Ruminococcus sp. TaxID=41978 RepID=UPI0025E4C255|nr:glycosyltransferase family 1 protein [Ruminococcus sp.]
MRIAFDVLPLIGCRMTGIGYCEAGQIQALSKLHPEDEFLLQFFSRKDEHIKIERLKPYLRDNVKPHWAKASGYVYRLVSNFLPVSYQHYFGDKAQVTHFFNYIVPPKVAGKTVVTVHDMVYKTFPETVRGRTKYMLDTGLKKSMKRADRIVTDSEFSRQEIIRYFPQFADKIRVVYCGVDTNRFHPVEDAARIDAVKQKYGIDREYFLYLGTVEPRKNLERLMDAYHQFCQGKSQPPYLVLAGGKGWLDSGIYQKVDELGLKTSVLFTEYVPDEEICPLMCGALAFVFPSIYEGFGLPPLEAMACGVPVLTTHAASLPEVVGEDAVVADPYDIGSIADGLEQLYTDPALRQKLSEAGPKRAAQFSWECSARQLYEVYQEVCGG